MINGVKITLIICLTILVSVVLFISYNEYIGRYSVVTTQDNEVYIFDKKSTTLNVCNRKEGCSVIETKLPSSISLGIVDNISPSKMFGKSMVEAVKVVGNDKEILNSEESKKEPVSITTNSVPVSPVEPVAVPQQQGNVEPVKNMASDETAPKGKTTENIEEKSETKPKEESKEKEKGDGKSSGDQSEKETEDTEFVE